MSWRLMMYIKFLMHGKGNAALAAGYVIDEVDHLNVIRSDVKVLSGDPQVFTAICDASIHKWKYTSAVIAWSAEDNPTNQQINEVLAAFEKHAFCGLEQNRYHMFAVLHEEENGAKHVHILVPRMDLETQKSLNIAPPGHNRYYDPLRNYFNNKYGWARPDDPLRLMTTKEPDHIHLQQAQAEKVKDAASKYGFSDQKRKTIQKAVDDYLKFKILKNKVRDYADICSEISQMDGVTKVDPHPDAETPYIAISIKDKKQPVRLKGEFYDPRFCIESYIEARTGKGASREHRKRNKKVERKQYREVIKLAAKRSKYNKRVFGNSSEYSSSSGRIRSASIWTDARYSKINKVMGEYNHEFDADGRKFSICRNITNQSNNNRFRQPGESSRLDQTVRNSVKRDSEQLSAIYRADYIGNWHQQIRNSEFDRTIEANNIGNFRSTSVSNSVRNGQSNFRSEVDTKSSLYTYSDISFSTDYELLTILCQQRNIQQKRSTKLSRQSDSTATARAEQIQYGNSTKTNTVEQINEKRIERAIIEADRIIDRAITAIRGKKSVITQNESRNLGTKQVDDTEESRVCQFIESFSGKEQDSLRTKSEASFNIEAITVCRSTNEDYSKYFSDFTKSLGGEVRSSVIKQDTEVSGIGVREGAETTIGNGFRENSFSRAISTKINSFDPGNIYQALDILNERKLKISRTNRKDDDYSPSI